jgi:hypothetical protein
MSLIIETGAGLVDAESYISVADATAYHAARGNAAWANLASDTVREQMLRRATDYMEAIYRPRWAGVRKLTAQALSWPRYNVPIKDVPITQYYPSDAVPAAVAHACAELALRAIKGELAPDIGPLKKRVKVAVIETEYVIGATPYVRFRLIDRMLDPFMSGTADSIRLVRA